MSIDELHQHKGRRLLDALKKAVGIRSKPLTFQFTTTGNQAKIIFVEAKRITGALK